MRKSEHELFKKYFQWKYDFAFILISTIIKYGTRVYSRNNEIRQGKKSSKNDEINMTFFVNEALLIKLEITLPIYIF